MIGHDDFDRTLADWFEADALSPVPVGGIDRVLDATRRRRPRPAWLAGPGSDWVGEAPEGDPGSGGRSLSNLGLRWSTTLIVMLVVAALVAGAILVGARLFQPSPLPTGRLGHLAYLLNGDIYLADWDGGNPVKIADGTPDPGAGGPNACNGNRGDGPMWSPDGRTVYYDRITRINLWILLFATTDAGQVERCCHTLATDRPENSDPTRIGQIVGSARERDNLNKGKGAGRRVDTRLTDRSIDRDDATSRRLQGNRHARILQIFLVEAAPDQSSKFGCAEADRIDATYQRHSDATALINIVITAEVGDLEYHDADRIKRGQLVRVIHRNDLRRVGCAEVAGVVGNLSTTRRRTCCQQQGQAHNDYPTRRSDFRHVIALQPKLHPRDAQDHAYN